jgi:DNA-binding transcriptional ArsR family regulator
MSLRPRTDGAPMRRSHASVFAALGDRTRLVLVGKLCRGESLSISELSQGSRLTRQAVTKHLRVLEDASLVHSARQGRRMLFRFSPERVRDASEYLDAVSGQWDQALSRLKSLVESSAANEAT